MIGKNKITFCQVQMNEAIECYIQDYLFRDGIHIKVTDVQAHTHTGITPCEHGFDITIEEKTNDN